MRPQTIRLLVVFCLSFAAVPTSGGATRAVDSPTARALRFFESLPDASDARDVLRRLRPAAIRPEDRERILATLPAEGDLDPNAGEATKLASLDPVLAYHDRLGVIAIKVIDVPQAVVGLHARAVLLLSRPALHTLSTTELQAAVAHEMGHEFFWEEYHRARPRHDTRFLHEVELKCDGIAAFTMTALGLDPGTLVSGARKLTRLNERLGATANAAGYPDLEQRAWFVREVLSKGLRAQPSSRE